MFRKKDLKSLSRESRIERAFMTSTVLLLKQIPPIVALVSLMTLLFVIDQGDGPTPLPWALQSAIAVLFGTAVLYAIFLWRRYLAALLEPLKRDWQRSMAAVMGNVFYVTVVFALPTFGAIGAAKPFLE